MFKSRTKHNAITRYTILLVWVFSIIPITRVHSQSLPLSQIVTESQELSSNRYVIFVDGINSSSSGFAPLNGDFEFIKNQLVSAGLLNSNVVYFSYGAAAGYKVGDLYCVGWKDGCTSNGDLGDLAYLNLFPKYNKEDTQLPIEDQAKVLDWLIGQIIKKDPTAQIDLIGFSQGGIIAAHWGSHMGISSPFRPNIHGIIAIESPLGGIPIASQCVGTLTHPICFLVKNKYGENLLRALQIPNSTKGSIVDELPRVADYFSFTSIQSSTDYTVNGRTFPLDLSEYGFGHQDVLVGQGSQHWIKSKQTIHFETDLGGKGFATSYLSLEKTEAWITENHHAPLKNDQTANWIIEAIGTQQAAIPTQTVTAHTPYKCETGNNYLTFDADYNGVTQVCPAHKDNKDGKITSKKLYVVIHFTSLNQDATDIQGNIDWFQDSTKKVSAHYLVGLNDQGSVQVIQLVKETDIAYHVGDTTYVTELNNQSISNSNSIGIEVVGSGIKKGWPADNVYATVADLVEDIVRRHKEQDQEIELTRNYIIGHEEISKRQKPDPGPNWDWQRFMETELEGVYTPAVELSAKRNPDTNEITLTVKARKSTRTAYQLEVSEDGGPFRLLTEIGENGEIANTPNYSKASPETFELVTYTPQTLEHPALLCYQAKTLRDNYVYANASSTDCIIAGLVGITYNDDLLKHDAAIVSQEAFPIVKPGQEVILKFKMRNTGSLSWKPNGNYVFINTGGESFDLATRLHVPQQIWTNEEVEFILKFNAPQQVGAYTTRWQMAYIDPQTDKVELFGKEAGGIVTVLKEGNTGSLAQIIQNIIDNAAQSVNQSIEDFLRDLQQRIEDEIRNWIRNLVVSTFPCLAPAMSLVITGIFVRKRKG